MNLLWHGIMGYFWGILVVVGFVFAAVLWVAMAAWDSVSGLVRRMRGQSGRADDGH